MGFNFMKYNRLWWIWEMGKKWVSEFRKKFEKGIVIFAKYIYISKSCHCSLLF